MKPKTRLVVGLGLLLLGLLVVMASGCASLKNTSAQDRAYAAYDACRADGRIPSSMFRLMSVEPDGYMYFEHQQDTQPAVWADVSACIREKRGPWKPA